MGNQYAAIAALFKARLRPGLSEEARRCILSAVVNVSAIGEDPNWRWESFTSVHKIPSQKNNNNNNKKSEIQYLPNTSSSHPGAADGTFS